VFTNKIIAFSVASWQVCPDTSRLTCGHIALYLSGVVAAQSHVPLPEMSTCAAAMNATVTRMLLYKMGFLGTPNYKLPDNSVSFPPSICCVDNAANVLMSTTNVLMSTTSPKLTKNPPYCLPLPLCLWWCRQPSSNSRHWDQKVVLFIRDVAASKIWIEIYVEDERPKV
jgi:hypothetical protein